MIQFLKYLKLYLHNLLMLHSKDFIKLSFQLWWLVHKQLQLNKIDRQVMFSHKIQPNVHVYAKRILVIYYYDKTCILCFQLCRECQGCWTVKSEHWLQGQAAQALAQLLWTELSLLVVQFEGRLHYMILSGRLCHTLQIMQCKLSYYTVMHDFGIMHDKSWGIELVLFAMTK